MHKLFLFLNFFCIGKLVQDVPDIQNFSIDEVCEWIIALGLDPRPFKENAVEGPDLLEVIILFIYLFIYLFEHFIQQQKKFFCLNLIISSNF